MRILLVPDNATGWGELVPLGAYLAQERGWEVVLVESRSEPLWSARARQLGLRVVRLEEHASSGTAARVGAFVEEKAARLRGLRAVSTVAGFVREQQARFNRCAAVLDVVQPDAVGLYEERTLGCSNAMVAAAGARGIPLALLPVSRIIQDSVAGRRRLPAYECGRGARLRNRLVRRLWPDQAFEIEGRPVLFYPPHQTTSLWAMGRLPRRVWVHGGGAVDLVLVASDRVREELLEQGLPSGKVRVTGQFSHDALWAAWCERDQRRAELERRYALASEKPLLMVAAPPYGEHELLPWPDHWREIETLFAAACETGANVLVSLHPRMDRAVYQRFERGHPLRLLEERLAQVLPAADAFAAASGSTLRWAAMVGVAPVLVSYLDRQQQVELDCATLAPTREGLSSVLRRALDPASRTGLAADAQVLGRLDGACGRRIDEALRGLVRRGRESSISPRRRAASGESEAPRSHRPA